MFNVPTLAKVIWRWGHRRDELRSNSGHLGTRQVVYPLHHDSYYSIMNLLFNPLCTNGFFSLV